MLSITVGKRSVKINSVTFTRPAEGNGQLTVKLADHRVKLFTITGRARVKRSATTEAISGLNARLARPGVKRLDRALHRNAFLTGQSLGSFTVTVSTSPIAGTSRGTSAGAGGPPSSGLGVTGAASTAAGVQFLPAFRSLLGSAGLSAVPLLPGSNGLPAPLGTTSIPGADGSSLTLPLSGGLQLGNGILSASLTNLQLTLGTGTEGSSLSFSLNGGPQVKLFDIDTSKLEQAALPNGTLDLRGLLATLSSEGAASLNAALGQKIFITGQPVGRLTLILPAPPQG